MKNYPPSIKDLIDFDKTGGIFFVHCPERYVLKCLKAEIAQIADIDHGEEYCFFDMSTDKSALNEAIASASELTLFASKRIIVLDIPEKLAENEQEKIKSYIDSCEVSNFLIVFIGDIDKRSKFFKSLQALTKIYFPIPAPNQVELKLFIKSEFAPFSPDERLIGFFLNDANKDMFFIHNEIDKLKLYAESNSITAMTYDNMSEMLNDLSEQVIFRIMDLLLAKKIQAAISLYRETIVQESEQKTNPVILSMLFKHFRAMMTGRILSHEGRGAEFSSYLSKNRVFYLRGNALAVADKYKNADIMRALKRLSEIELGMKGAYQAKRTETCIEIEQFMAEFFL